MSPGHEGGKRHKALDLTQTESGSARKGAAACRAGRCHTSRNQGGTAAKSRRWRGWAGAGGHGM
eukprot:2352014-Pleurochrysis_carterae.AAC.1